MKIRLALLSCALAAVVAFAADATGKWSFEQQGRNGTQTVTLTLKADGDNLTGNISGGRGGPVDISDGKVSGDAISFTVVREFQGNKLTSKYNGKLSGDELKLTIDAEGPQGKMPTREVTAKRVTT